MKLTTRTLVVTGMLSISIFAGCIGITSLRSNKTIEKLNSKLETILYTQTENRSKIDELTAQLEEANRHECPKIEVPVTTDNIIREELDYAGEFTITHYCGCKSCNGKWYGYPTASGIAMKQGRTIAVDPAVIPLGTKVVINGNVYVAEDTGSAIKGNRIDIFIADHDEANELGIYTTDVWKIVD